MGDSRLDTDEDEQKGGCRCQRISIAVGQYRGFDNAEKERW